MSYATSEYDKRKFITEMDFIRSDEAELPCYRVMDNTGKVLKESDDPKVCV